MNGSYPELTKKILLRIERIERRRLVLKASGFGIVLAVSLALVVYGSFDLMAEASRSGFLAFSSLFFSDFSATIANFSDFILSMIESFPVFSATLVLSGVFFAIWSAAGFVSEVMLMVRNQASRATA